MHVNVQTHSCSRSAGEYDSNPGPSSKSRLFLSQTNLATQSFVKNQSADFPLMPPWTQLTDEVQIQNFDSLLRI